ncbi:MAG: hypothetical protein GKR87_00765 [Kiritimatiellae bacterium]|nr:hypothetical protein [Kiritimatiellia bacterium]
MKKSTHSKKKSGLSGKLRIGDDWNAITIIALSQNNPLKAIAEFVENSIDAHSRHIIITRGREGGEPYLRIVDDGEGIPQNEEGQPNFKYVATHICDSIKRHLKATGITGLQGEFGIGLLSFWTVGEELTLTSAGMGGKTYEMKMRKGEPGYRVKGKRVLIPQPGTELKIKPLLPGIRQLNGDKIQRYLASELRDRIRQSGVTIKVIDRHAGKQYIVEPREFEGRLLHQLPSVNTLHGEIYLELYLTTPTPDNSVSLYRPGTRVLEKITDLDAFQHMPWSTDYLQGIIEAPFLNLTPGTRTGIIQDTPFYDFCRSLEPVEQALIKIIEEQKKAEEERASHETLRAIQKAFKEALLALPVEEYDWFDIHKKERGEAAKSPKDIKGIAVTDSEKETNLEGNESISNAQKQFFEYAGPLFSVRISPTSCVVPVNEEKTLHAIPRDRSRLLIEQGITFQWEIIEGTGTLSDHLDEMVTFKATSEPGLTHIKVTATQNAVACESEALLTVTDALLLPDNKEPTTFQQGLPSYTFKRASRELSRSRYDTEQNIIVINNGHRDFVYASRFNALKLRYMCRLFSKELVFKNFPGHSTEDLLERMIELSLYTEEHLK